MITITREEFVRLGERVRELERKVRELEPKKSEGGYIVWSKEPK